MFYLTSIFKLKIKTHVGTDITLEAVLHFVMLEGLCPVKIAVAVTAAEPLYVTMRQQMPLQLVGPRELAHAAQVAAERTLKPLRQVVNQHVTAQSVFPLESGWAMLQIRTRNDK